MSESEIRRAYILTWGVLRKTQFPGQRNIGVRIAGGGRELDDGFEHVRGRSDRLILPFVAKRIDTDVGPNGGVFRVTDGLHKRFGAARVVDTPLAESGIIGTSIGLAMAGLRPVSP